MAKIVKISSKGQITIPKEIRETLGVKEGASVVFDIRDKEVVLRGIPTGHARKLKGVFRNYVKEETTTEYVKERVKEEVARAAAKEG